MNNTLSNSNDNEYYKMHPFIARWMITIGVLETCEQHKCHWILDIIGSYVSTINKKSFRTYIDYMLVIEVAVNLERSTAIFTISHEVNQRKEIIIKQNIGYTDLTKNITLWAVNETHNDSGAYESHKNTLLLLPSEY